MTLKVDRSFYRKSRSNGIVKLVREQYLRSDIPCLMASCTVCHSDQSQLLDPIASHYIIPDMSVIMRYQEILEQDEITGIILSQTIVTSLEQHDKTKTYRKLRNILNDRRRKSVLFYNEIFDQTKVMRLPGESMAQRDWRSLYTMAQWYQQHLSSQQKQQTQIILLSEVFGQQDVPSDSGIVVYTTQHYLATFFQHHALLQSLVEVLAEVVLEEDLDRIHMSAKGLSSSSTSVNGYTEYKSMNELEVGIKSARYYSGPIRCRSESTRHQASIHVGDGKDILIIGNDHRNRAVHGDVVVVELLSENNWATPSNEITFGNNDEENDQMVSKNGSGSTQPTGRVVGILNRNWRSYVATIQQDETNQGGSFHLAIPLDSTIPKIRIRYQDVKLIENQRIVVRIDNWPVSSQYPNGHYVRSLGPIHQLDSEISAILVEHGISVSQASQGFSEASLKEMPVDTIEQPWKPSLDQLECRKDLRSLTLFSIDPPNCQDIDDALSVRELNNGLVELGVHIADVSFFVKENSLTDLEARARATTVYLADRRFDMLPSVLSERVCSLRHNVDRYAVSVLWTIDKDYNIKDTWFGRSVIRSSCEMEYEQAQQLLDGKAIATGLDPTLCKKLAPNVKKLAEILRVIKERRLQKGALELESTEVKFKMADNHQITDIIPKDAMEIHGLVAEAMILANASVGKKVYDGFKNAALLRRHPSPTKHQFRSLIQAAESRGFSIDFRSNRSLAQSLEHIVKNSPGDVEMVRLIKTMATYAMNEAGYISSGHYSVDQYYHYGLALDFYTHFTSPIRRYADVVAHRQLLTCMMDKTALEQKQELNGPSSIFEDSKVAEICDNLNLKSRESKLAQRDSTELFQSLYVLQQSVESPLVEDGIISEVRSNGFYVFVPRLGLKGPVFLMDKTGQTIIPLSLLTGKTNQDDEKYIPNCTLEAQPPTEISVHSADLPHPIRFCLFDRVRVMLKLRQSHAHRHMVYMTLIDRQQHEHHQQQQPKMTNTDLMQSIQAAEPPAATTTTTKSETETRRMLKKNKQQNKNSMYSVLEQFRKLAIVENQS
ncbi:hypothetical protein BC941DRAFT_430785 [Chlamydoabsidia padenii]|nr:hypothetical protein BC941DRAFT_430785 [Chlamydoabsidia padenii]